MKMLIHKLSFSSFLKFNRFAIAIQTPKNNFIRWNVLKGGSSVNDLIAVSNSLPHTD